MRVMVQVKLFKTQKDGKEALGYTTDTPINVWVMVEWFDWR